jgi:ankyrin repeat protein
MASAHGRGNSVAALLKAGADTALTDANGIDAINAAAFHGQWGVSLLPLALCWLTLFRSRAGCMHGHVQLYVCVVCPARVCLVQLWRLADSAVSPSPPRWQVVNLLVKHNVDPDVPAQDGWTPLFRACWGMEAHHTDTVNILLRAGVDFQKRRNGKLAVSMVKHKPTFDLLKKYKDAADGKTAGAVEQTQAKAASGGGGSTDPLYGQSRHDL